MFHDRAGKEHTVIEVVVRQIRPLGRPTNGNGEQPPTPSENSQAEFDAEEIPF
jgi:hypothetical protein